ncbi:MAG: nucleotide exchange factor GrpE [Candidatus Omnitrophica bacterium]|nr:nucleotide exchange factor GrpE [Candidatus Omnitrophota bacterium]MBU0896497.1 nucleotide exchange factor GrpE [Candidatus Omnitrophota bacterium]MBU1133544.1 nucleotide exchange factor GrpE [Candidatus Omnitrophota bacterium]MBU1366242.1 nucleotide exchange factor GrpE [Candidatus Omnitrophota bacterium]MBU1524635.1 nucleotide exchange factor GrpE [Candidatus Omnitrophota bacterium]
MMKKKEEEIPASKLKECSSGEKENQADIKDCEKDILSKAKEEYNLLWDKHLRFQAEFDNYKKRSLKEKAEFIKFANEGLILELLSILDNFERGIKSTEQKKDFNLLHQGVEMISLQLHSLLNAKGLNKIKSVGEKFNPHQHEAIEVVASEDIGIEEDIVIEEMQAGYMLDGRVIRPAKVKVCKKAEEKIIEEVEKMEEKLEEEIAENKEQTAEDKKQPIKNEN